MAARGVHFSLSEDEVLRLRGFATGEERRFHVVEVIEVQYFEHDRDRMAESDKAWDAMHRALTDGRLASTSSHYPLSHLILGGEHLYHAPDYLVILKTPRQVEDVANVLPKITEEAFRQRYFAIGSDYEPGLDETDLDYTWSWFQDVREFWLRAASEKRFVLFTVDQ